MGLICERKLEKIPAARLCLLMVACRLLLSLLPSATALVAFHSAHAARPSHALAMSEAAEIVTFVFDDEGNARELDERKNELAGLVVPTTIADPVKLLSTGSKVKKALITAIPVEDATAAANNLAAAAKTLAAAAATAIQRFVVYVRTLEVAAVVGLVGLLPKTVSKDRALATLNSAKSLGLEYVNVAADALSATRMRSVEVTALIVLLTKTTLLYNVECALMIFQKLAALGLKTADATTLAANTVKVFQNDLRPIVAVYAANAASTAASMADKLRLNEAANKLLLTGVTTANKLKLMQAQVSLRTIARVDLDEAAVGLAAKAVETAKETVTEWKDAFQVLCDRRRAETWSPENAPTEAETWAAEVTRMHDGAAALRQSALAEDELAQQAQRSFTSQTAATEALEKFERAQVALASANADVAEALEARRSALAELASACAVEAVHKAKSKVRRRIANHLRIQAPAVHIDSAAAAKAMKIEVLKAEGRTAISRREIRANLHSSPSPSPVLLLASVLMATLNKGLLAHAQLALSLLAETHSEMAVMATTEASATAKAAYASWMADYAARCEERSSTPWAPEHAVVDAKQWLLEGEWPHA